MEVAHYRVQQDSGNLDSDQVSVVMETPPSSKNIFRKSHFTIYRGSHLVMFKMKG